MLLLHLDILYLEIVKRLPKEKSKENFLGFMTNIGRKEMASPKQIAPKKIRICVLINQKSVYLPSTRLLMNPIILCFLLRLGKHPDIFLANQL